MQSSKYISLQSMCISSMPSAMRITPGKYGTKYCSKYQEQSSLPLDIMVARACLVFSKHNARLRIARMTNTYTLILIASSARQIVSVEVVCVLLVELAFGGL